MSTPHPTGLILGGGEALRVAYPSVSAALAAHAASQPGAIVFMEANSRRTIDFAGLDAAAGRVAAALSQRAAAGSAIALAASSGIDAAIAYCGITRAGMAPVLLPAPETEADTARLTPIVAELRIRVASVLTLATARARTLIGNGAETAWAGEGALHTLDALLTDTSASAPVEVDEATGTGHWIFTSGTTGPAKAVRLAKRAVAFNLAYTAMAWEFEAGSRIVGLGAPFHSAGLMVGYLMPIFAGAGAVLVSPADFARNPDRLLAAIAEAEATHLACPDSTLERCLDLPDGAFEGRDLSRWRMAVIGGEPLSSETLTRFEARLARASAAHVAIGVAYGMTEAAGLIATSGRRRPVTGAFALGPLSKGRATPAGQSTSRFIASGGAPSRGVRVAVIDAESRALSFGRIGRVVFASPSLFDGYEGGETAASLTLAVQGPDGAERAGFFETGDLGFVTQGEAGPEIAIVGRAKEAIRAGSRLLHALDLERVAAAAHPALSERRVVAAVDSHASDSGALVLAEIEPDAPVDAVADAIRVALDMVFSGVGVRVALVASGGLPVVPTSSKKPRLRAAVAFLEGHLPVLPEKATRDRVAAMKGGFPITALTHSPAFGARGWRSEDVAGMHAWAFDLLPAVRAELGAHLAACPAQEDPTDPRPAPAVPRPVRRLLAAMRDEAAHGFGFSVLRGLPVDAPLPVLRSFVRSLGEAIGVAMLQNTSAERVCEVTNRSGGASHIRGYQSRVELPFHSDTADMLALLCVRPAREGGDNALVSTLAIHDALAASKPDLLAVLERGFAYAYPEAPDRPTERIPVFARAGGLLSCRYLRAFIEAAGPLELIEREALDAFDALATDPCFATTLQMRPGDLLLVNNYTVLHSRTAFVDFDAPEERRLLLRLWLNAPNFRTLDRRIAAQSERFHAVGRA